jgi:hypothetical protein
VASRNTDQVFYFVCTEGVIWSFYHSDNSWQTNYLGPGTPEMTDDDNVELIAEDGEILDEFTLWPSLQALAQAIEGGYTA